MSKELEEQVGGDHYKDYEIQPLDFCYWNGIPCVEASIIKYVVRHQDKGGLEDLLKAKHLLEYLIKNEYGEE